MKKILFVAFILFGFVTANAQITITADEFPAVPTDTFYWRKATTTGVVPPSMGENQFWNYQDLQPIMGSSLWRPYRTVINPLFPNALRGWTIDTEMGFITLSREYYEGFHDNGYGCFGVLTNHTLIPLTQITGGANDKIEFPEQNDVLTTFRKSVPLPLTSTSSLQYPITFTTNFNLTIAAYGLSNAPGQQRQIVDNQYTVVGWGTTIIPTERGVSEPVNCLLMKHDLTVVDSFYLAGSPMTQSMLTAFGLTQGAISSQHWYIFFRENTSQQLMYFVMNDTWQTIEKIHYDISSGIQTNSAPTIFNALADLSVDAGSSVTIDFTNTFDDVNAADILTFTATLADDSPLPTWLALNTETKTVSGTAPTTPIALQIKITATDILGSSISDEMQLSVIEPNVAPSVVNPVADLSVNINTTVTIDFSNTFADANDGDVLTYTATLSDGTALPQWLTLNTTTKQISGTTPANADTLLVKITATDLLGLNVSDEVRLIIINNSGIENFNIHNIAVTPNPAKDKIVLTLGNSSSTVYLSVSDSKGNIVLQKQKVTANQVIDVNKWSSGVYYFKFQNEGQSVTKKLVVE